MKKLLTIVLTMVMLLALTAPAGAYDMGKAGQAATISMDWKNSAAIDKDGFLWTWGDNEFGQLGAGSTDKNSFTPVKVSALENVVSVSVGYEHMAAVLADGSLWTWGHNDDGQLGINVKSANVKMNTPQKVMDGAASVSAGQYHTVALKTDGSVWTWGRNTSGQLGNGIYTVSKQQAVPIKVMDGAEAVCAGDEHTAVIKTDGSLWLFGDNSDGQIGNGGDSDGQLIFGDYIIGSCQSEPVKIMDDVAAVSLGSKHSAAIKKDGSLWVWGCNEFCQIGNAGEGNMTGSFLGDFVDGWTYKIQTVPVKVLEDAASVRLGRDFSSAVKTDGTLWMWGGNYYGQMGRTKTVQNVPVQVMEEVSAVSAGYSTSGVIKKDGSLWVSGYGGRNGNLGLGTEKTQTHIFIQVPNLSVKLPSGSLVTAAGTGIWAWVENQENTNAHFSPSSQSVRETA